MLSLGGDVRAPPVCYNSFRERMIRHHVCRASGMTAPFSSRPRVWWLPAALCAGLGLAMVGVAQQPPAKSQPPDEEVEARPAVKKVVPVDDGTVAKPTGKEARRKYSDFETAIEDTKHPAVKQLYESLRV